jgi:ribosomal protein S12 methylthiotransferase accessory factor YcaO
MSDLIVSDAENSVLSCTLRRVTTESATGYFGVFLDDAMDEAAALALARQRPNDEFLRRHLLRQINAMSPETLASRVTAADPDDRFLQALFLEACLLDPDFADLRKRFAPKIRKRLAQESPLIFIRSHLLADQKRHARWMAIFRQNILEHRPLPAPGTTGLPGPFPAPQDATVPGAVTSVTTLAAARPQGTDPDALPAAAPPEEISEKALARLSRAGVVVGKEMRHEASLSPIALLRNWQLDGSVTCGRHRYRLSGEQIAYGRGLDLESARVACVMEVVERVSAYADIVGDAVVGYKKDYPLIHGRASALRANGIPVLNPNRLCLEVPYRDDPIYWIEGEAVTANGPATVWVPAQCVFLFLNLDEVKLFSALGSTGLGAGSSTAQAKAKALLEVIERDSEAVTPFTPAMRFDIETADERVAALLSSYARSDVHIQFLDITSPMGVPCCKCFVTGGDGTMAFGVAAHLDARKALISAMTETPYPYPYGPPSQPVSPAAVRVRLEDLPDCSAGAEKDQALLESVLLANGYEPIYVDLTRADLDLPVVRAIVPGMELLGDFDRFSRVHPRLYANYRKIFDSVP